MKTNNLKNSGLIVTLPRLKILELFEQSEVRHLSADDIYKKLILIDEKVSLATIYRVLTQFQTANLLIRHHFEDGRSVFELNEGSHHDHLVCDRCGKIEEFFDETIEKAQHKIADKFGFRITDHNLQIFGVCPACQKNK